MRKSIKSEVDYDMSYYKEFDDMVEEWGYDVNDQFTYMMGVQLDDWKQEYTNAAKGYGVDVAGYYILGDQEGMILVGTLKDIFEYCDDYWGIGLHPDYVCPADSFDYEDGEWVTGGWIDSSRKAIKSAYVIYYNDFSTAWGRVQEGKLPDDFVDANGVGLVINPNVGAMQFDTPENAEQWLKEHEDEWNPEWGEILEVDENGELYDLEGECLTSSRKPVKSAKTVADVERELLIDFHDIRPVFEENGYTLEDARNFERMTWEKALPTIKSIPELEMMFEEEIESSRKPIKSSYNEDDIIFRATTRGGKNFVEVTDTGTDFDRYEIKQNGSVDYANSTAEILAKLIKQSGWKEGMFDKIEIDNTGTSLGEQYLQIMKMINKEFGSLYKAPNGSAERQYYFDIIKFIAWNIQSHSSMSIEDMIWKAKDALNKKGITSSKKRKPKTADERAKDEGADITCSRKSIKSSMDKLDMMCMIEEVCDKLRDNVPNSKIDYNMNDKTNSGWIEVVQENKAMGPGYDTMWTFWVDFDKNTVEMLDPQELDLGTFKNDYDIYTNIKTGLSGGGKRPR